MSKPIIQIHNIDANKVIEREMTNDEFAQWQKDKSEMEAKAQQIIDLSAKREAALAKLAALGLEPDDLKALGF